YQVGRSGCRRSPRLGVAIEPKVFTFRCEFGDGTTLAIDAALAHSGAHWREFEPPGEEGVPRRMQLTCRLGRHYSAAIGSSIFESWRMTPSSGSNSPCQAARLSAATVAA